MKSIRYAILIAIAVLAVMLLMPGEGSRTPSSPEMAVAAEARAEQTDAVRTGARAALSRSAVGFSAAPLPIEELLRDRRVALSEATQAALQSEVASRFALFLQNIEASASRSAEIQVALVRAYGDIHAFGAALERGEISAAEAAANSDPNYVVNQLAALLSPEELMELEVFLESDARQRFLTTYTPQLEVVGVDLSADNRERLLQTLFNETHALINADGIGAASNLESGFQRQLEAIENTRANLRQTMTAQQFEQADRFLGEQERGLLGAQTIFSTQ